MKTQCGLAVGQTLTIAGPCTIRVVRGGTVRERNEPVRAFVMVEVEGDGASVRSVTPPANDAHRPRVVD